MNTKHNKQVELAKYALAEMQVRKIKKFNGDVLSCELKHTLEEYLRRIKHRDESNYISEQACIQAMHELDFKSKLDKYGRTIFNVSTREITSIDAQVRASYRNTLQ